MTRKSALAGVEGRLVTTRTLAILQGSYYAATGVWPLLSMRTFEAVTGPKTDRWLVNTVGLLVGTVGAALLVAGARRGPSPDLAGVAVGSALALGAVDTYYSLIGRISKIYLLDAAAEAALVGAWCAAEETEARGENGLTRRHGDERRQEIVHPG